MARKRRRSCNNGAVGDMSVDDSVIVVIVTPTHVVACRLITPSYFPMVRFNDAAGAGPALSRVPSLIRKSTKDVLPRF